MPLVTVRTNAIALTVASLVCLAASTAHASGITLGRFGGIFGHPNADGGLALYWNPARLSVTPGYFATIDTTLVYRNASYDRIILDSNPYRDDPGVLETNTGRAEISTAGALPYLAVGGSWEIDDRLNLAVALGAHPAYGGTATWDKREDAPSEYPGAIDGPQRWSGISSTFLIIHYTASVAVTLTEYGLSFGVGVTYADGTIDTVRARNVNRGEQLLDDQGYIQEGRIFFSGGDSALSLNIGLSLDRENVRVSAHYRGGYNLTISGDLFQAYATQDEIEIGAFLDFPTPHVFQTAVTAEFGRLELTGVTDYTTWSRMVSNIIFVEKDPPDQLLDIPRNLNDTLSLRGIMGWNFNENLNVSAMLGFDPSAVPDETIDATLSDAAKIQLGAGARFQASDWLRIMASYQYDFFREVTTEVSIQEPTSNGTYNDSRHWMNLSLEGRW